MGLRTWVRSKLELKAPFDEEVILPDDEIQEAYLRAMTGRVAEQLSQGLFNLQAEARTTSRWLLATMVTLNAGAAVAVANSDHLPVTAIGSAISAFAAGCVFAILSGALGALIAVFMGGALGRAAEAFRFDEMHAQVRKESFLLVLRFTRRSMVALIASSLLMAGSLGSFILGMHRALNLELDRAAASVERITTPLPLPSPSPS